MPEIAVRLLADLHPNGTVRMVYIAHTGGGNECPITAKNFVGLGSKFGELARRAKCL